MKPIFLLLMLMMSTPAFSQLKEKQLTQAEEFSLKTGTLIERQFIDIGKIKNMEVKVVTFKDINTGVRQSALRFEVHISRGTYSAAEKISTLDSDEATDLIKAIKSLQSSVFTTTRDLYTEVNFRSKGGFTAGAFYSKDRWTPYVQTDRYDDDTNIFLSLEDFSSLLALVETAKTKMQ